MNIRDKLILAFFCVTALPVGWLAYIAIDNATETIKQEVENGLNSTADGKLELIYHYIHEKKRSVEILASLPVVNHALTELPAAFAKGVESLAYIAEDAKVRLTLNQLNSRFNSYDLFLISLSGDILFTVIREDDFGTNLKTGPYKKTELAVVFNRVVVDLETRMSTFKSYLPSQWQLESQKKNQNIGQEQQSAFVASPVLQNGELIGVVAIQLHGDDYFHLATSYTGLKKTGEIVIGKRDGKDALVIAPLRYNPLAAFTLRFPLGSDAGLPLQQGVQGQKGAGLSRDYDGKEILAAWRHIPEFGWGLVVKIDAAEAFASAEALKNKFIYIGFGLVLLAIITAIIVASRLSSPLKILVSATEKISRGDLLQKIDISSSDEIGQLAQSFNHMLHARKKYEDELKESSQQAEFALAELNEQKYALDQHAIVAITNVKGDILFVNQKFSDISGYAPHELIGQNHNLLKSGYHQTGYFKEMYRTIAGGKVWHGEICNKAKDGRLYWLDTTIAPFFNQCGKPEKYISIRTDVTERKRAEAELLESKDAAESATRLKSEFLANMSHEIRTPMNGVMGMTGLLLDTDLSSKQRDYANSAMRSADALLTIINDILDVSKIEAGKMELECIPFDLQLLAEDVSEMMALKCREKGLEMLLRYKPGMQRFLMGDPGRIRQILLNLLSNAIKFTEQGNILLTVELLKKDAESVTIIVKVKDSGIGIDSNKLSKIFNKFDQEDGSTTRKFGGTGLGLSICRQLSRMMGGDTLVESEKGKGSTFSFTMALGMANGKEISSSPLDNEVKLAGLKALIVDDVRVARTILKEQLASLKLNIDTASSGQEAIEKLKQAIFEETPYDVVVTDFNMPGMNGEMLADEINRQSLLKNGVLLFVTSSPRKGDGKRLKKMGFDGYLIKPTQLLEVPQVLTVIWDAKSQGKNIPLVTRHTIQEARSRVSRKTDFSNVEVLLVEDNPINQMVASEYLERYGCNVTTADNGREAVEQIQTHVFDLIFMDCQMPVLDGYEATAEIRKHESLRNLAGMPIIAFTANAMQGDKDKCLAAGMDDYMSKPVSQEALEAILAKWLPDKVQSVVCSKVQDEVFSGLEAINDFDEEVFDKLQSLFQAKFSEVVELHVNNSCDNVVQMTDAIEVNDLNVLERAAHSLKGSSAQFGAIRLSQLAAEMEQLAKQGEPSKVNELFAELRDAQKSIAQIMRQKVG